jgi:hypothetical protein
MMFVAVYTSLRVSELIGLRWRNIRDDSITIEERCCRDWGAPKSEASNATIPVNRAVIERIIRLRTLLIEVKAGTATRRFPALKSDGPDDLVFQSVSKGAPMRDNNILVRHIKPAARKVGMVYPGSAPQIQDYDDNLMQAHRNQIGQVHHHASPVPSRREPVPGLLRREVGVIASERSHFRRHLINWRGYAGARNKLTGGVSDWAGSRMERSERLSQRQPSWDLATACTGGILKPWQRNEP